MLFNFKLVSPPPFNNRLLESAAEIRLAKSAHCWFVEVSPPFDLLVK
jgi:hypothetical protein